MAALLAAHPPLEVPILFWVVFMVVVVGMLLVDMVVFHRRPHEVRTREALGWTVFWIALALVFNAWIWWEWGREPATDFFVAFIVEKSLSVDNLFVFLVLFSYFKVPASLQHRVLFYGVLGALVMRLVFVLLGAELLEHFHWMNYAFGAFLVFTAVKLLLAKEEAPDFSRNPMLRLFQRFVPFSTDYADGRLTVVRDGRRTASMMLVVIAVVEATDVAFAVDSVPAVLAVTPDRFIAFTSNVAAILGLRAIYFLLARFMTAFRYLKPALALILGFVGVKMFKWFDISSELSLLVIAGVLVLAVVASVVHPERRAT